MKISKGKSSRLLLGNGVANRSGTEMPQILLYFGCWTPPNLLLKSDPQCLRWDLMGGQIPHEQINPLPGRRVGEASEFSLFVPVRDGC